MSDILIVIYKDSFLFKLVSPSKNQILSYPLMLFFPSLKRLHLPLEIILEKVSSDKSYKGL